MHSLNKNFSVENVLNYILLAHESAIVPPKCACLLLHVNTEVLIYHLVIFFFLISNSLGKPFGYNFIIFKSYTFFIFFNLKK